MGTNLPSAIDGREEKTMKLESIKDLYVMELRASCDGERQMVQVLPELSRAASSPDLKAAFDEHLQQTRQQVQRLETIFQQMDMKPAGKHCRGIAGIVEEGKELLKEKA